jgi:hypothetical protein
MRKYIIAILLITLSAFAACKDTGGGKTPADDPKPAIVPDCTIPENQTKPECVQKCIEDPTLEWCTPDVDAKYTCPTDGSFKAVNPFSGIDATFSDSNASVSNASGNISLAAKPVKDGEFVTLLSGSGSKLFLSQAADAPSADLGHAVVSIDTFKLNEKVYAIVGTANNLSIVPFSEGNAAFETEGIKALDLIGGIKQVVTISSIDISGSASTKSLPPGMSASVNVPLTGAAATSSGASLNFTYLVSASGDVWRVKNEHLVNGGCFEKLYSASDHKDSKNNNMTARKIAVAGQYVVILSATADGALPALDSEGANAWSTYENGLLAADHSQKLITSDYYWLINHLAYPQKSSQKVMVLNLLTSKTGNLEEVQAKVEAINRYFATDLAIKGNSIYFAGFNDDFVLKSTDKEIVEGMTGVLELAKGSVVVLDETAANFLSSAGATIFLVDASSPNKIKTKKPLPKIAGNTAAPIFARIAMGGDKIYFRGEDKYFALAKASDLSNLASKKIDGAISAVPWLTIYDENAGQLVSTFIIEPLEKINISEIQ